MINKEKYTKKRTFYYVVCFVCGKEMKKKGLGLHFTAHHKAEYEQGLATYGKKMPVYNWAESQAIMTKRREEENAENKKTCPKCSKEVDYRGMAGHMRMAHQVYAERLVNSRRPDGKMAKVIAEPESERYNPPVRNKPQFIMVNPNLIINRESVLSLSLNVDRSHGWIIYKVDEEVNKYKLTIENYDRIAMELM